MFLDLFEIETHLAGHDLLAILAAGFETSLTLSSIFVWQSFRLEPECEWVSDFPAQQHRHN